MSPHKLSSDEKEYYDSIYTYGPWLLDVLGRLAFCLRSFHQAKAGGASISIIINSVVPTFKGSVSEVDVGGHILWQGFDDLQGLRIILDIHAEKVEAEYDKTR